MMVALKKISGKVGRGAPNNSSDVKTVQTLLNKFTSQAGFSKLKEDGLLGPRTEAALQAFQRKVMNASSPKKVIEPGGDVLKHLNARIRDLKNLSGSKWFDNNQNKYPTSKSLSDLEPGIQRKVRSFVSAMRYAGATVKIEATERPKKRAEVMNRAWLVMKGQADPTCVTPIPGVAIEWDHGDKDRSKAAALELARRFGIQSRIQAPSPNSRHVTGHAVDMDVRWSGDLPIIDGKGQVVIIKSGSRDGTNRELHKVGASYGVKKLLGDKPHWSSDGR
jgi:peptidoglycan hydrolase-like protein with peptidoglycan-binding domain